MCSCFGAAPSRRLLARDRHACSDECCPKGRGDVSSYGTIHSHTCKTAVKQISIRHEHGEGS